MENYPNILALDPGKHCGWAWFTNGIMTSLGTLHGEEEIWSWLGKNRPDCYVVEDYKIRDEFHKGFDHQFQSVFPAQVIGAIRFFAYNIGKPVFLQQPQVKYAASKMIFHQEYQKKSNKHHLDAHLHGAYFIMKNKLSYPRINEGSQ